MLRKQSPGPVNFCQVLIFPRRRRETIINAVDVPMARVITGRPNSAAAAAPRPLHLAAWLQKTLITPLLLQAAEVAGCCSAQPGFSIGRKSQRNVAKRSPRKINVPHPVSRQTGEHPCLQPTAISAVTRA